MSGCTDNKMHITCPDCHNRAEYLGNGMGFECKGCGKIIPTIGGMAKATIWEGDYIPTNPELLNMSNPYEPENVRKHKTICLELNNLYVRKNRDYGDSFHISFEEEGMAMARIRLGDKLNRFKTLTKAGDQLVQDESIRDTLIDLANYAIMTVMEIDRMGEGAGNE